MKNNNKKKMLYICAFPPNRMTAGQNYSLNLLQDLVKNIDVDLIYWGYNSHKYDEIRGVNVLTTPHDRKISRLICMCFFPIFPLFSKRFNIKVALNIRKIASSYDYIYFDFSQIFVYSLFISHPHKIGMSHDVIFQKYSRYPFSFLFSWWVKLSEKLLLRSFDSIFTFSQKDRALLAKEYDISSNVVSFYIDDSVKSISLQDIQVENYFVMYGAWNRVENIESLDYVLSEYDNSYRIKIIGPGLSPKHLEKIKSFSNLEYLGFVDNPYIVIAKSIALIAPLFHGAGVKVKAVESLSLGTIVIGTEITFEGLPTELISKEGSCILIGTVPVNRIAHSLLDKNYDKLNQQELFYSLYPSKKFIDYLDL